MASPNVAVDNTSDEPKTGRKGRKTGPRKAPQYTVELAFRDTYGNDVALPAGTVVVATAVHKNAAEFNAAIAKAVLSGNLTSIPVAVVVEVPKAVAEQN